LRHLLPQEEKELTLRGERLHFLDLIMRQVPYYLLIGNGRVAHHIRHYFSLLGISFATWQRGDPEEKLQQSLQHVSHVLLLITDAHIESFIQHHLKNSTALRIHCSGSLVTEHAYGAHPLMTFNKDHLYSLAQYQAIPFIVDDDAPAFEALLPGLPNPHVRLKKSLKPKYHALCVLSGNFSCLLWQKLFSSLEREFHFPADIAYPYLQQQTQNLLRHYPTALTGPLVRSDQATIQKNLTALAGDPFQEIYQAFINCYCDQRQKETLS
jgi:hypothetical protein